MGGGDLNAKKSWHPNTIKNQKRVWEAEQAAAEEKKRTLQMQQELTAERSREELNKLAKTSATTSNKEDGLHWMYNKPDKKIQQEDYLLGKAIEPNYDGSEKPGQDFIPAVARRIAGSSMLTSSTDTQVDLTRKMREDPLILVKERERAARAALLNNPIQRRRLAELLKKEQEKHQESKIKKTKKKSKNIDNLLAEKLSALSGKKGVDIAALLGSDDSDSSTSTDSAQETKKKKKKKSKHKDADEKSSKKPKKSKKSSVAKSIVTKTDSSDDERDKYNFTKDNYYRKKKMDNIEPDDKMKKNKEKVAERQLQSAESTRSYRYQSHLDISRSRRSPERKRRKEEFENNKGYSKNFNQSDVEQKNKTIERTPRRRSSSKETTRPREHQKYPEGNKSVERNPRKEERRSRLNDEERQAKLAEMAAAGAERERDRGRRVAQQRERDVRERAASPRAPRALALPDSLHSRIHSNRHYIQRGERHMNEHFARR